MVLVPKYRRAVITERVFATLRAAWEKVIRDFECELLETGWESDHVRLLVGYPPKVEGVSARRLRAANLPEVQKKLWGEHFWSPSYCAVSSGGAPLEIVKRYVQTQRGGASSPP